jgi:hypothetical protein
VDDGQRRVMQRASLIDARAKRGLELRRIGPILSDPKTSNEAPALGSSVRRRSPSSSRRPGV